MLSLILFLFRKVSRYNLFVLLILFIFLYSCNNSNNNKAFYPFVDNHDGTITDRITNLTWSKASYTSDYTSSTLVVCSLTIGGYSDWRIPDIVELRGLYTDLGMMTQYKATDSKDRQYAPFQWKPGFYQATYSNPKPGCYASEALNFKTGEELIGGRIKVLNYRAVRGGRKRGYTAKTCPACNGISLGLDRVKCSHCNGTGIDPKGELRSADCGVCSGRGVVYSDGKWITCPRCNGEKVIFWRDKCPVCNGSGFVWKQKVCKKCNGRGYIIIKD